MKISIGIGIILVVCIAGALILKKKKRNTRKANVPTEVVDKLSLEDVVGFFRTLQLEQGKHQPFISTSRSLIEKCINLPKLAEGDTPVVLGVYDSSTDDINPLKLLLVKNVSQEIVDFVGDDPMVVLA